ncbi:hypothetical protein E0H45_25020 [Kribbella soli]|uniref:Uncharacterized protein n=1 Tax=Kribbella soli TaxID=1124743 RepID=A0A4R0HF71_9ACTN|nr:hypothetical protein E0H45_25020 [Kribbella soli]
MPETTRGENVGWPEDELERRRQAEELIAALDAVEMDFSGSAEAWRYGGGRDLSRLAEKARERPQPTDVWGGTDTLRG